MLIDATDKFLDRMSYTLAKVKGNEPSVLTHCRFINLTPVQLKGINLRAAMIMKGKKKGA